MTFMLLEGIRVIEWSDRLAAPFCARVLADLGAEIIKIEPLGQGDALRRTDPLLPGADSALFAYANHGKRSLTLDPTHPAGAKLLLRLLERTALLVHSQHSAALRPLGLAGPAPYEGNPVLTILAVTACGPKPTAWIGTEIAGALVWLLPCRDGLVMVSPREQHQWDR
jgi:crotonobetainyl-CoA:carnitine CoA-transferase CaiB-like acyl-CoA transferase